MTEHHAYTNDTQTAEQTTAEAAEAAETNSRLHNLRETVTHTIRSKTAQVKAKLSSLRKENKETETETETDCPPPPIILELPPYETEEEILSRYWLTPPHAHAVVTRNIHNTLCYHIIEPKITEKEYLILEETFDHLRSTLIFGTDKKNTEDRLDRNTLITAIKIFNKEIEPERLEVLLYYLNRNFLGYDKLDPLMHDEQIEDITCNGDGIPLYLYHRTYGSVRTDCIFGKTELNKLVLKLAQKADKQVSLTTPLVDAALPDGSRAQITYSDIISAKGSSFTIRKFKADPMTPADLVRSNTYSAELMAHIWLAVENRKSLIVAGGTASGKTSTMNAASFFIPEVSKIVSIEDTCEIQLPHTNWLSMKTRESAAAQNHAGNISMFTLLKAALRQRPEYIIVGEVRGEEAQTLFQAMNTGHTTFSTLHAGTVSEAVNRLTNDPINVPEAMFGALDLIVVQSLLYKDGKGFRRCTSLNEISVDGNEISTTPIFCWNHQTDTFDRTEYPSRVMDAIAYQNGWTKEEFQNRINTRIRILTELTAKEHITAKDMDTAVHRLSIQEKEYA